LSSNCVLEESSAKNEDKQPKQNKKKKKKERKLTRHQQLVLAFLHWISVKENSSYSVLVLGRNESREYLHFISSQIVMSPQIGILKSFQASNLKSGVAIFCSMKRRNGSNKHCVDSVFPKIIVSDELKRKKKEKLVFMPFPFFVSGKDLNAHSFVQWMGPFRAFEERASEEKKEKERNGFTEGNGDTHNSIIFLPAKKKKSASRRTAQRSEILLIFGFFASVGSSASRRFLSPATICGEVRSAIERGEHTQRRRKNNNNDKEKKVTKFVLNNESPGSLCHHPRDSLSESSESCLWTRFCRILESKISSEKKEKWEGKYPTCSIIVIPFTTAYFEPCFARRIGIVRPSFVVNEATPA
jgi:hypothetical protein